MRFNEIQIGATFRLVAGGRLLTKVSDTEYRTPWGAVVTCKVPAVRVLAS